MDLYELKVQKQEAELAYLRSQIDPHFLYNTLEVIRKMALDKKSPEIAQMALDMGSIFRYSAKGDGDVTLEEEIAIIKSYIRIQQMRFAGKNRGVLFYFGRCAVSARDEDAVAAACREFCLSRS